MDLLEKGKGWVKLSGAYADSKIGPPSYSDREAITKAYVKNAPERLVWGTDWPHPTVTGTKPDDAALLDLLLKRGDGFSGGKHELLGLAQVQQCRHAPALTCMNELQGGLSGVQGSL